MVHTIDLHSIRSIFREAYAHLHPYPDGTVSVDVSYGESKPQFWIRARFASVVALTTLPRFFGRISGCLFPDCHEPFLDLLAEHGTVIGVDDFDESSHTITHLSPN